MNAQRTATWWQLHNEARYAQRLCQRTARLYKRLDTAATFLSVVAGSAALSALAAGVPPWVPVLGAVLLTVTGAVHLAVRPAEKAALNDADVRKYAELMQRGLTLDEVGYGIALATSRASDAPEIEPLRDVAYNDMVAEIGRPDLVARLRPAQRVLAALA